MTNKANSAQHQLLDQLVEEIKKNLVEEELHKLKDEILKIRLLRAFSNLSDTLSACILQTMLPFISKV